jgi:hypothetical protein
MTSTESYQWQNNAWVKVVGVRWLNTYHPSGPLASQRAEKWDTLQVFRPIAQAFYSLEADGRWGEIVQQQWQNGAFLNKTRIHNFTWHNWTALQPATYEEQQWSGSGTWDRDTRHTFTFQPNGSYVGLRQKLTPSNTWIDDQRYTRTYDNFGTSYSCNRKSGTMALGGTLAGRRATELEHATAVYPNPTTGAVTISLPNGKQPALLQAEVLNTLGQVVQTLELRPRQGAVEYQFDLQQQPAGLYLVRLHTSEGTVVKQVVKL